VSGMADVIRMHSQMGLDEKGRYCKACNVSYGHSAERELRRSASDHVAAMLTAADYGDVEEAKAQAWDEGYGAGKRVMTELMSPTHFATEKPNPYRAAAVRGEG
jgi:hypothetical protein